MTLLSTKFQAIDFASLALSFRNKQLYEDTSEVNKGLKLSASSRKPETCIAESLKDPRVQRSKESATIILSLIYAASKHRVIIDIDMSESILVKVNDRKQLTFRQNNLCLFMHDTRSRHSKHNNSFKSKNNANYYSLLKLQLVMNQSLLLVKLELRFKLKAHAEELGLLIRNILAHS